jgi:hypothetical protein
MIRDQLSYIRLLLTAYRLLLSLCPLWLRASFPGTVTDGVSFVDCIVRGVRSTKVVEASLTPIPSRKLSIKAREQ